MPIIRSAVPVASAMLIPTYYIIWALGWDRLTQLLTPIRYLSASLG